MVRPIVLIDARMVGPFPHGIARYVSHLAAGLAHRQAWDQDGLPYRPIFLVPHGFQGQDFFGCALIRVGSPFLSMRELFEIPSILKGSGAALYHSPSFSSLMTRGPFRISCPWIQTLHDLNHLSYGGAFHRAYYRRLVEPFAQKAAALCTVSDFSRQEIAAWLGKDPADLEIVHNALDPQLVNVPSDQECRQVLERFGLESGRYFFCLSNPKPHKNISFLVESYRDAAGSWPLVLSMKDYGGESGVKAVGALQEGEVRVLRACAGAVVFPSLYEGFGLPPIEAALAGVPVIVSDISPHREGLQDLTPNEAHWIDPRDRRLLMVALQRAEKGELRSVSLDSRRKILERFSEDALARHMDRIYRRVLELSV